MNVLAIESSGRLGSVAACRDMETLAEESLERGMEHGRMLVGLIDRVVQVAGWNKQRDIDLVAVSQGPGSFTGLRVGVTCAKTIAAILDRPLVGICSMDALAENAPGDCHRVLTVLDARRGQVYAAAYERRDGRIIRVSEPEVTTPSQARELLEPPSCALGDGVALFPDVFSLPHCRPLPADLCRLKACTIAKLALEAFHGGRRDDPAALEPIYLRLAEAEERRRARERGPS